MNWCLMPSLLGQPALAHAVVMLRVIALKVWAAQVQLPEVGPVDWYP